MIRVGADLPLDQVCSGQALAGAGDVRTAVVCKDVLKGDGYFCMKAPLIMKALRKKLEEEGMTICSEIDNMQRYQFVL